MVINTAPLALFFGHFIFGCEALSTSAFVSPLSATHRPPMQRSELSTCMLPRHGHLPLGLHKQRPKSQSQSFDTTAATRTLTRDDTKKFDSYPFADESSNLQDFVAILILTCVSYQMLFMSLSGQMQVFCVFLCIYALYLHMIYFFDFGAANRIKMFSFKPSRICRLYSLLDLSSKVFYSALSASSTLPSPITKYSCGRTHV